MIARVYLYTNVLPLTALRVDFYHLPLGLEI